MGTTLNDGDVFEYSKELNTSTIDDAIVSKHIKIVSIINNFVRTEEKMVNSSCKITSGYPIDYFKEMIKKYTKLI